MAEIYSAVTTGVGSFRRPVVIKRLRPELAADPQAVAQFRDEANLLAAFNHPNIVAVHDFGRWDNRFFLAEEYVAGRNLGRIIEQCFARTGRPPALELIAYVAREILKALDYAHRMESREGRPLKIVHRESVRRWPELRLGERDGPARSDAPPVSRLRVKRGLRAGEVGRLRAPRVHVDVREVEVERAVPSFGEPNDRPDDERLDAVVDPRGLKRKASAGGAATLPT